MNILGVRLGYIVKFMAYIKSEPTFSHFAADDMVTIAPVCSANTAELEIVYSESDDYNIRVRIDYVCIGNENEMVSGNHWLFTLIGIVATYRFAYVSMWESYS